MTTIRVIRSPTQMRALAENHRRDGVRIALVPTMGFLHDGHLALLRKARSRSDILILSIFVNPTQFGPGEDLDAYPRDETGDLAKAASCGVDIVFCPTPESMYPHGYQTIVRVAKLATPLCGQSRPGHFDGVATVVTKLFQLTQPHLAVFGEKDFQQLALIRRMNLDLNLSVEISSVAIVREPDGLALSSRNRYLTASDRMRALSLHRGLEKARDAVANGQRNADQILDACRAVIHSIIDRSKTDRIDYIELRDAETLAHIEQLEGPAVLALAVFIGGTRLIDNAVLLP